MSKEKVGSQVHCNFGNGAVYFGVLKKTRGQKCLIEHDGTQSWVHVSRVIIDDPEMTRTAILIQNDPELMNL
jgi:hypothetical protein